MKYTQNKYSIMYSKIDRKQLSEQALATLEKLRKATGNFRTKNQEPLDLFEDFYKKLEDKKPTAIKGSVAYKEMIKEKQKQIGKELYRQRVEKQKAKAEGKGGERDAHRPAKPYGWRLKGKHNYKKPTRADITEGRAYYEGRVNRADVKRKKYPMLERGGNISNIGGNYTLQNKYGSFTTIKIMPVDSNYVTSDKYFSVKTIVRAKEKEGETLHIKENFKTYPIEKYNDFIDDLIERGAKKYTKGGYMAKGGEIKVHNGEKYKEEFSGSNRWLQVDDKYKMTSEEHENEAFKYNRSGNYELRDMHRKIAKSLSQEPIMLKYGGYMAKGGRIYKDWNGRNTKEMWGKEDLYSKYDNNLDLIADVSDYYKKISEDISENYAQEQKNDLIKVLQSGKINFNDGATLKFAKGGMISHGFRSGDKIIEIYKGYGIIENTNGGIEVINPSNGTRFVIEEGGDPKKYIDWANQSNPIELVPRIDTGSDRTTGSMDANGVQYGKGGVFYTEKHKND